MKNFFIFLILLYFNNLSAQNIVYGGNTIKIKNRNEKIDNIETVYGTYRFNISLDNKIIEYDDDATINYVETLVDYKYYGFKLLLWSTHAYYEVYLAPLISGGKSLIMILEFPYVGEVEYKQYYNVLYKPTMAH